MRYNVVMATRKNIFTRGGIVVLLLIIGIIAYMFNFQQLRPLPSSNVASSSFASPTPTVCPTLYNGPQPIIENGRLILITPTPHPCQPILDLEETGTSPTPVPQITR